MRKKLDKLLLSRIINQGGTWHACQVKSSLIHWQPWQLSQHMSGCYIRELSMRTEPPPSQTCVLSNIGFMIGLLLVAPEAWGSHNFSHSSVYIQLQSVHKSESPRGQESFLPAARQPAGLRREAGAQHRAERGGKRPPAQMPGGWVLSVSELTRRGGRMWHIWVFGRVWGVKVAILPLQRGGQGLASLQVK